MNDDQLVAAYRQMIQLAQQGQISKAKISRRLQDQVLPQLEAILARLARCDVQAQSPSTDLKSAMARYFELKRQIVRCDIDRFRAEDPAKTAEAEALANQLRDARSQIDRTAQNAWAE